MKVIIIFGPPGCGKGTQSEKIIQEFGYKHYSTGDMLRYEVHHETEIGIEIQKIMEKGQLVPDEIVIALIKNRIKDGGDTPGVIFDGFPRTLEQAKKLDEILEEHGKQIDVVLSLKVETDELVRRILERGKTSKRVDDQSHELVMKRVEEYTTKTAVLKDYYQEKDKLFETDGIKSIDEVFNILKAKIETL